MKFAAPLLFILAVGQVASAQSALDVRVEGAGYLRFMREGRMVFAKQARLVSMSGCLCDQSGAKLVPSIAAATSVGVSIDLEGNVMLIGQQLGRIVLALLPESSLVSTSSGFFQSSGRPTLGNPGEGENGVVRTGARSASVSQSQVRPSKEKTLASLAVDKPSTVQKSTGQSTARPTITFAEKAEVDGDTFTISQVADVSGNNEATKKIGQIVLGDTPTFGIDRIIDRTRLYMKLRSAGIDPDTVSLIGPEKIRVSRKGQTVTQDQFVDAAVRGAKLKGYSVGLESMTPGPNLSVPVGELQLVCESISGSEAELTALVGIYVDGKRFNSRSVRLKTTGTASTLKAGSIIKVRVVSHNVKIESSAKVVKVDQTSGTVTVQVADTGAILTGLLGTDGVLEVKA